MNLRSLAVLLTLGVFGGTAFAQYTSSNRDILTPNTGTWNATGVTLNGLNFVNLGLQGVGRIAASTTDPVTGESIGSISDMQINDWTRTTGGSYTGTFNFLPDRGYNAGSTFSNYAARINTFSFTFTPYTSPSTTTAQNQIQTTYTGTQRFTYDHDNNVATSPIYTTGLLANGSTIQFGGQPIPTVTQATSNPLEGNTPITDRLTLDTEGLAFDPRAGRSGSGWVSDEYGANIYHFNSSKQIDGILAIPKALVPHSPTGTVNFNVDPPIDGRRINQGFEGLAVNHDGTRLYTLLQSATIQDSGSGNQGRTNTRLLVYDTSSENAPTDPIAQYVIQLPRVDSDGGGTVDRTAAQSSIIAISDTQFLILSRDGNGRGASGSPVFKSILLADISKATNIDGLYDFEGAAVAPGGVLAANVTPLEWTEALNLLSKLDLGVTELEQFGLNLNTAPGDINSLSEKWEGLSLVSANDPAAPNDYFLFMGNDNDFLTSSGSMLDANGNPFTYNAGLENDTMLLAFRVQIVPEPGVTALLAIGSLAFFGRRRARCLRL
ncbi:MAG TPA: esterase-like activity of phytase family protein [Chthoniobacterales bacterium]